MSDEPDPSSAPWAEEGYDPAEEGRAFDRRIEERVAAGFVPDLRHAVHCDYFYKSFWRDPLFVDLYLGHLARTYLSLLEAHAPPGATVLDVGCGPGYFALELARAGYRVTGIDVSGACVRVAEETRDAAPEVEGFGALEYRQADFAELRGRWDVLLFSGSLHHFPRVEAVVEAAVERLAPGGLLLAYEPIHEAWRMEDAAQVALVRALLSVTGHWYEGPEEAGASGGVEALWAAAQAVHTEYVTERDPSEAGGQSPHDLESGGEQILAALRSRLEVLEVRPMVSFIYRMLGGLRGPPDQVRRLAELLTHYDRMGLERGLLRPNCFLFLGRSTAPP